MLVSVILVSALIALIGILNGAQAAFSQVRRGRLDEGPVSGSRRVRYLLRLIENQERTVAATRVAVTLLVVATSLFAGGPLIDDLVVRLNELGIAGGAAEVVAYL
jgi:CBS domain containing-hemolysin-like protein